MLFGWSKDEHVYIDCIHHQWSIGDVMLSHDLWLDVGCNFTYAIQAILVVNVGCNFFMIVNWNHKLIAFGENKLWPPKNVVTNIDFQKYVTFNFHQANIKRDFHKLYSK